MWNQSHIHGMNNVGGEVWAHTLNHFVVETFSHKISGTPITQFQHVWIHDPPFPLPPTLIPTPHSHPRSEVFAKFRQEITKICLVHCYNQFANLLLRVVYYVHKRDWSIKFSSCTRHMGMAYQSSTGWLKVPWRFPFCSILMTTCESQESPVH